MSPPALPPKTPAAIVRPVDAKAEKQREVAQFMQRIHRQETLADRRSMQVEEVKQFGGMEAIIALNDMNSFAAVINNDPHVTAEQTDEYQKQFAACKKTYDAVIDKFKAIHADALDDNFKAFAVALDNLNDLPRPERHLVVAQLMLNAAKSPDGDRMVAALEIFNDQVLRYIEIKDDNGQTVTRNDLVGNDQKNSHIDQLKTQFRKYARQLFPYDLQFQQNGLQR